LCSFLGIYSFFCISACHVLAAFQLSNAFASDAAEARGPDQLSASGGRGKGQNHQVGKVPRRKIGHRTHFAGWKFASDTSSGCFSEAFVIRIPRQFVLLPFIKIELASFYAMMSYVIKIIDKMLSFIKMDKSVTIFNYCKNCDK
jgi:hypothetical protein